MGSAHGVTAPHPLRRCAPGATAKIASGDDGAKHRTLSWPAPDPATTGAGAGRGRGHSRHRSGPRGRVYGFAETVIVGLYHRGENHISDSS